MWVYDFTPEGKHVLVRGNVRQWLISHRVPAYWLPRWRGWQVRSERVPDLLAQAELDGILVAVRGPAQMPAPRQQEARGEASSSLLQGHRDALSRGLPNEKTSTSLAGEGLPLVWGAA